MPQINYNDVYNIKKGKIITIKIPKKKNFKNKIYKVK